MCFVDLEPCEVWNEEHRKAKKPHDCSCCNRVIAKGESYLVHFSIFERSMTKGKLCAECERDRKEFAKEHDGTLCGPAFFWDMLLDCIGDDDEDGNTNRWRQMTDRIQRNWIQRQQNEMMKGG